MYFLRGSEPRLLAIFALSGGLLVAITTGVVFSDDGDSQPISRQEVLPAQDVSPTATLIPSVSPVQNSGSTGEDDRRGDDDGDDRRGDDDADDRQGDDDSDDRRGDDDADDRRDDDDDDDRRGDDDDGDDDDDDDDDNDDDDDDDD